MQIRKLVLLVFTFLPATLYPQEFPGKVQIDHEQKGSLPPVPEWYACMRNLDGKPFDRKDADKCLQSILSHPYLTGGKVVVEPGRGYTLVSFILESPSLTLLKVEFQLSRGFELAFAEFISNDEDVLRAGDIYDSSREAHTAGRLDQFLRSEGAVALVSRDLALDYDRKTASLVSRVSVGPSTIEEEPLLPNGRKCEAYVGDFNEIDMDDYTPLPLVNTILGIRRTVCFSSEAIKKAEQELNKTDLFSSMQVTTAKSGEWRNVTVSARTKPTKVGHILYKWYGTLSETHTTELPSIPLAENQAYRRSAALGSRDILVDFFRKPGLNVKVYEEVMLQPDHQLTVVFHILGAKMDTLSIDGKEIRSPRE